MKIKKIKLGKIGVIFSFLIAILAGQFSYMHPVSAAALTWDGSTGDNKFSTAANWSTGSAPVNGDSLVFPVNLLSSTTTLNNDITGLVLTGITFSGEASAHPLQYIISGNAFSISGDINSSSYFTSGSSQYSSSNEISSNITITQPITITATDLSGNVNFGSNDISLVTNIYCEFYFEANLTGSGTLSTSGTGDAVLFTGNNSGFTGSINSPSKIILFKNIASIGSTTSIVSGANLKINLGGTNQTISANLNLGGTLSVYKNNDRLSVCMGGEDGDETDLTLTLSGDLSLSNNLDYYGVNANTNSTGTANLNGHQITTDALSLGSITLAGGQTVDPTIENHDYSNNAPSTEISVNRNNIANVDGTYGNVTVDDGGYLKGVGSVQNLIVASGAIVAPGHSPGTLTVLASLSLSGTYEAELLNKNNYDQLRVGEGYTGSTAVTLGSGSVLQVTLYDGWSVKTGDQFTIIDNRHSSAVSGTFSGLAEGTQFTVSDQGKNIVFSITYVGGDGNDVVITALNTGSDPSAPNTGIVTTALANPIIVASFGIVTTGLLLFIARKKLSTKN